MCVLWCLSALAVCCSCLHTNNVQNNRGEVETVSQSFVEIITPSENIAALATSTDCWQFAYCSNSFLYISLPVKMSEPPKDQKDQKPPAEPPKGEGNSGGKPRRGKMCYHCGETGHIARDCENPRLEGEDRAVINKARAQYRWAWWYLDRARYHV